MIHWTLGGYTKIFTYMSDQPFWFTERQDITSENVVQGSTFDLLSLPPCPSCSPLSDTASHAFSHLHLCANKEQTKNLLAGCTSNKGENPWWRQLAPPTSPGWKRTGKGAPTTSRVTFFTTKTTIYLDVYSQRWIFVSESVSKVNLGNARISRTFASSFPS